MLVTAQREYKKGSLMAVRISLSLLMNEGMTSPCFSEGFWAVCGSRKAGGAVMSVSTLSQKQRCLC